MSTIRTGILFNGLITTVVAAAALMFIIFLARHWPKLNLVMRTYAWVWGFTASVWLGATLRYIIIGFNYSRSILEKLDALIQILIFLTGPPLFFYIGLQLFKNKKIAAALAMASFAGGVAATYYLLQPHGLRYAAITYFSADVVLNPTSLYIFGLQVVLAVVLLAVNVGKKIRRWRKAKEPAALYAALYSLTLLLYVGLAGLDNAKFINDWPLIFFRLVYSAIFLFTYLVIVSDEARREFYLIDESGQTLTQTKNP